MNDIIQSEVVYKTNRGTPVTDSVKVARVFEKQHKNVMKSIRNILGSAQNLANQKGLPKPHTWMPKVSGNPCS